MRRCLHVQTAHTQLSRTNNQRWAPANLLLFVGPVSCDSQAALIVHQLSRFYF